MDYFRFGKHPMIVSTNKKDANQINSVKKSRSGSKSKSSNKKYSQLDKKKQSTSTGKQKGSQYHSSWKTK